MKSEYIYLDVQFIKMDIYDIDEWGSLHQWFRSSNLQKEGKESDREKVGSIYWDFRMTTIVDFSNSRDGRRDRNVERLIKRVVDGIG